MQKKYIFYSYSQLSPLTLQAKALLTFVEAISEKTLRSTVALTAARGRGKSAAMGLSIAAAIAHGLFLLSFSPAQYVCNNSLTLALPFSRFDNRKSLLLCTLSLYFVFKSSFSLQDTPTFL